MAKPKAYLVDWLKEARHLTDDLLHVLPPPGLLADPATWKTDEKALKPLRLIMAKLQVYLTSRIGLKTATVKPEAGYSFGIFTDEPMNSWPLLSYFTEDLGMTFSDAEVRAFAAHQMLGQVLRDGWIDAFNRRQLPVQIASIQGVSASQSAAQKASRPRPGRKDRNTELREAKSNRTRNNSGETWKETLQQLQGDGLVIDWTDKVITWRPSEGETRTTRTSTFIGWHKER